MKKDKRVGVILPWGVVRSLLRMALASERGISWRELKPEERLLEILDLIPTIQWKLMMIEIKLAAVEEGEEWLVKIVEEVLDRRKGK